MQSKHTSISEPTAAVQHLDRWILQALELGASDLHFETTPSQFRIRFRIDGKLHLIATPPMHLRDPVLSRLKILARMDIAEKRLPQDGRIQQTLAGRTIDLRVSSLPTVLGEKIVLRVLNHDSKLPTFHELGLQLGDAQTLEQALHKTHGMVLFTGATGSGKTLSLYSCLHRLNQQDLNISTVEDPCEIRLPGINQTSVNEKIGLDFAHCLRALLRQDPDVLMVGEIRDTATARIAMQAAQTGHRVLSTLHANDAPSAITRLKLMGVEPFTIASGVRLIVAQRLLRRLCPACKQVLSAQEQAQRLTGKYFLPTSPNPIFKAVGCVQCVQGYKGRIGVFQLMPVTSHLQALIAAHADDQQLLSVAQQAGMASLQQDAWLKVQQGLTSLDELETLTQHG
jgi:type IV pilus assembly protein PilB